MPAVKAPKWYPADDIKAKVPSDREAHSRGVAKLKKTIKPGSVLILLGGRFRGKRVVFLKQLSSGLLLVTGPYQLNGVPLRRVNQAYCISTSASVDVKGADVSKIDDAFFARTKKPKSKKDGEEFFGDAAEVRPRRPSPAAAPPPVRQEGRPRRQDGEMGAGRCGAATGDGRTAGGTRRCPCGGRLRLLVVGPVRGGGRGSARRKRGWQCGAAVACGSGVRRPGAGCTCGYRRLGDASSSAAVTPFPPPAPLLPPTPSPSPSTPSPPALSACPLPSLVAHLPLPPSWQKPELKPERVAAQKAVDGALVPAIKKTPLMDSYLKTLFSLSKADAPHKMKF